MAKLYLGRNCDPDSLEPVGEPALLDTRKLTRHGVLLGMTGSGKTGLAVCMLEEIAMSGVPILAIDPKGDLTNLKLNFPELRPADFEPWIDPAEAKRKGVDVATRAADVAETWSKGHASWEVDDERRRAFAACPITVYTPGSTAGVPVDVLASLRAPPPDLRADSEGVTELATGTVSALLGLVGVEADPFRDPEAIVMTQILHEAWTAGEDLSLEAVLTRLVDPPFGKVGVFPVDTFFPRKKRMDLAMKLNAVVASPAFTPWSQGVPLDLDAMLASAPRAPIHVFTTTHLDEDQRRFFVSTLLNALVAWSRRQPGTGDLRALLYMDEVYGYLPPHPANPPTKRPILTLMKQARAVGVGVVVATQNPVDLDYKALSNAGTWLVGRLQTEQDRERVVDGLAAAGGGLDRGAISDWLSRMPGRTFVYRDSGSPEPTVLHSRWAISYLRGPLTRREIERLPKPDLASSSAIPRPSGIPRPGGAAPSAAAPAAATAPAGPDGHSPHPPPAPGGMQVRYLKPAAARGKLGEALGDLDVPLAGDGRPVWIPALWVRATLRFDEGTTFTEEREEQRLYVPLTSEPEEGLDTELSRDDFVGEPPGGWYAPLPDDVDEAREISALEKSVVESIYRGEVTTMYRHSALRMVSHSGEDRAAFEARVKAELKERADDRLADLHKKIESKATTLQDRIERKSMDVEQARVEVRAQTTQEVVNVGETIFGMFFGGRKKSVSTAVSRRRQTMKSQGRVSKLEEELRQLEAQLLDLHDDLAKQMDEIVQDEMSKLEDVEEKEVGLEKNDISIKDVDLVWVPVA